MWRLKETTWVWGHHLFRTFAPSCWRFKFRGSVTSGVGGAIEPTESDESNDTHLRPSGLQSVGFWGRPRLNRLSMVNGWQQQSTQL